MTTQRNAQQTEIETRGQDSFGFLEEGAGATSSLEGESCRSLLCYVVGDVFVVVELDWRESAVFVLVGMTVDGQRPPGYYVDSAGRHVRWHLGAALDEGDYAEQGKNLTAAMKNTGHLTMLEQIDAYAVSLRTALPELPRLIQQLQGR